MLAKNRKHFHKVWLLNLLLRKQKNVLITTFPSTHICLLLNYSSLHIWRNNFPPYEDLQISYMLFTSHNTPHITLGNEQCLKQLLAVCNTKKTGDLSITLQLLMTFFEASMGGERYVWWTCTVISWSPDASWPWRGTYTSSTSLRNPPP